MSEYRTVQSEASDSFIERKSRFIGYARPVRNVQEATDFINEIRSKHWDATHNVYAYVLRDGQIRRYSDDGEPQGTAGVPVLDVLLKEDLCDVCVVVTRYFGGILLGAGGLVRAYSHSAKIAVETAKIITMALCTQAVIRCDYNFYGKLSSLIPESGGVIEDTEFTDSVAVTFCIPKDKFDIFNARLIDLSFGKLKAEPIGEKYSVSG